VWGRFINEDDVSTIQTSPNLFTYCCNNPIMNSDPTGLVPGDPLAFVIAAIFAIVGGVIAYYLADALHLHGWVKWIFVGLVAAGGAILGYFAGEALVGLLSKFIIQGGYLVRLALSSPFIIKVLGLGSRFLVVLGKMGYYVQLACSLGAKYYYSANWTEEANMAWLKEMADAGETFILSNNYYGATGMFQEELQWLLDYGGYKVVAGGWALIKK
jgi:hypothetical protein